MGQREDLVSIIIHIMTARLSLAQLNIALGDPEANLHKVQSFAREAASAGSQFLLLPELWSSGYDLENARRHAQANLGILEEIKALAVEYRLSIGGSLLLEEPGGVYNSFVLAGADGLEIARYNKLHLFRLMGEDSYLQPGQQPRQAQTVLGPAGFAVCYDLRFPELFRRYALDGAEIVLLPAEWPARRQEHWNVLLRARAIENQMYVAGVNITGPSGGETFAGGSAVISPWGETLASAGAEESLIHAEIDSDAVRSARERIPIFRDRRPEMYE